MNDTIYPQISHTNVVPCFLNQPNDAFYLLYCKKKTRKIYFQTRLLSRKVIHLIIIHREGVLKRNSFLGFCIEKDIGPPPQNLTKINISVQGQNLNLNSAKTQVAPTGQAVRCTGWGQRCNQTRIRCSLGVITRRVSLGQVRLGPTHGQSHGQTRLQIQLAIGLGPEGPQPNCPTGQAVRVMVRHVSCWAGGQSHGQTRQPLGRRLEVLVRVRGNFFVFTRNLNFVPVRRYLGFCINNDFGWVQNLYL